MKYLSLIFIVIFTDLSYAQIDKILKNKDIVWAAEVTSDLVLDDMNLAYDSAINYLYTLKYTPFKYNQLTNDDSEYLISRFSEIIGNRYPARVDSITIIDPVTKQTKVSVVATNYIGDYKIWRLREYIYYNSKTNKWASLPISVTPISTYADEETGKRSEYHDKLMIENKKVNLNSKNITWAKRTATRLKGYNHLFIESVKVLKNTTDPIALFFYDFKNNIKNTYYNDASIIENHPMTPSVRKAIFNNIDTIVSINPNNFEQEVKVIKNDIQPSDIRNIRLVHDWYWDNKRQKLYVRLAAVAPMKEEFMPPENIYERPLFYQKYD
jgi:hypothetical protein